MATHYWYSVAIGHTYMFRYISHPALWIKLPNATHNGYCCCNLSYFSIF